MAVLDIEDFSNRQTLSRPFVEHSDLLHPCENNSFKCILSQVTVVILHYYLLPIQRETNKEETR